MGKSFYNYDVAVHAGQYLAKDVGATLEVRRTFRNGWQLGAWATMTDVSSEDFGEGSFDKDSIFNCLDSILVGIPIKIWHAHETYPARRRS